MKRTALVLSVLWVLAGTAPASAAFLGENPRLGESFPNTTFLWVSVNVSRELLRGSGGSCLERPAECLVAPSVAGDGWTNLLGGMRIQQVGSCWVKEVNPNASAIAQWWGRGSLDAQASALGRLGDMAPDFTYINGQLVTQDVGQFSGSLTEFGKIWAEGSWRLGTPMNDIRFGNIGANGLIFDPALHPIQQGIYWGGTATVGALGGTYIYYKMPVSGGTGGK